MGYRLEVTDGKYEFYGFKHYGYHSDQDCDDIDSLKCFESFQYLMSLGKVKEGDIWGYGCNNHMTLTAEQFRIFMPLYIKEAGAKLIESSLSNLICSPRDKVLEWW